MKKSWQMCLYTVFLMAEAVESDVDAIIAKKLSVNNKKYPKDKAFGSSAKYTEL